MARIDDVPPVRADGLQLVESRAFQERFWRAQRLVWIAFGALMLAALLGLTGSGGPLHSRVLQFPGASVEMPRIARWEGNDEITVTLRDADTLAIGNDFFDGVGLQRIQPEPETVLHGDRQEMRFSGPGKVVLQIRPEHFGLVRFDLGIGGHSRPVRLLVLP
ncbi:hypothetical protein [Paracoccus sp. N5]|uniref:hypothetical protein n=1 Tax=Paracoccus sp. N5 TaxID=1101189 RepID=UPI0003789B42|nr:hypothetical protein [Paracoccus sp. N5]